MDAAITVAIGLGAALLGVVGGFWGADRLERRREARRRRGVIAAFFADLIDNWVKAHVVVHALEKNPKAAGPLWTFNGPVSANFWHNNTKDAGSFIPFDLFFKMQTAYKDLDFVRVLGDRPQNRADQAACIGYVKRYMELVAEVIDELTDLPEAKAIRSKKKSLEDFVSERRTRSQDAPD